MTDHQPPAGPPPPPTQQVPIQQQVPTQDVWQHQSQPHWQPGAPPQQGAGRRIPGWIVAVAVATAVASVTAFAVVLLWPDGSRHVAAGPLEFHGFAAVTGLPFDQQSRTTLTAVHGDQGYAAWEQNGNLQVISFDVATGEQRWRQQVTGAAQWGRLLATPDALLVLAHAASSEEPRTMFVRDAETGDERWRAEVTGADRLFFSEQTMGWLDQAGGALRGLNWETGTEEWSHAFDGSAQAVGVTTPAGLARPTDPRGDSLSPVNGGDDRIVLVTSDQRMRVFDGTDGRTIDERGNVADPTDLLLLAYEDQLFLAKDERGYRVESYNLTNLADPPRIVYTSPSAEERHPDALEPCGAERICLLDTIAFDDQSLEAAAVDVADGGELWRTAVPGAERLIPVGEWLVVNRSVDFDPVATVLTGAGEDWRTEPGAGVRLNDGNLLLFSAELESGEVRAAGVAIEVGQPIELGRLPAVEPDGCTWNDRHILCAGREAAEIWRFAADD